MNSRGADADAGPSFSGQQEQGPRARLRGLAVVARAGGGDAGRVDKRSPDLRRRFRRTQEMSERLRCPSRRDQIPSASHPEGPRAPAQRRFRLIVVEEACQNVSP